jgi:hypothetical protein
MMSLFYATPLVHVAQRLIGKSEFTPPPHAQVTVIGPTYQETKLTGQRFQTAAKSTQSN